MVKEVEIQNSTEILETGLQPADFEKYPDIVSTVLSNNGETLVVTVNRLLKAGSLRKVALYYMLPQYEIQIVSEYHLGTFGPSNTVTEATTYSFDLNPVLTSIVHTAPEQLADDTVTIKLFTYEANISTAYGSKTLHVPYLVSYPATMVTPASTDGWYELRVLDINEYNNSIAYEVPELVHYNSGFFKCIAATTGNLPTDVTKWAPLTDEEEHNLYEFGYEDTTTLPTVLCSELLITRYIKQKFVYELLARTNYKKYDDITVVTQLEKICSMREAAIVQLSVGNFIAARYMLDQIIIENNSFTVNNGERKTIETITNFTI